ncbi:hypothetical protein OS493_018076 [Desmophyllum pertusum]|uniref:Uncharacterized protein n=1 Tax=Desmophyllum pertusum TaxID=174260 RepID=A0A9W9YNI0_9CNID|nr:hypothetical protein OS493_018076 [Desmophyllum pertusum]
MAGYLNSFIKNYAAIAAALYQLTRKETKFHWGKEEEENTRQHHNQQSKGDDATQNREVGHGDVRQPGKDQADPLDYCCQQSYREDRTKLRALGQDQDQAITERDILVSIDEQHD